jgi:hypothetical protein
MEKALWFIESHFATEIALDDIAKAGGVSRFHLTRAFGAATGRPPEISPVQDGAPPNYTEGSSGENLKACLTAGHPGQSASTALMKTCAGHEVSAHDKRAVFAARVQGLNARSQNPAATTWWNLE